jgi:hypothetical protein
LKFFCVLIKVFSQVMLTKYDKAAEKYYNKCSDKPRAQSMIAIWIRGQEIVLQKEAEEAAAAAKAAAAAAAEEKAAAAKAAEEAAAAAKEKEIEDSPEKRVEQETLIRKIASLVKWLLQSGVLDDETRKVITEMVKYPFSRLDCLLGYLNDDMFRLAHTIEDLPKIISELEAVIRKVKKTIADRKVQDAQANVKAALQNSDVLKKQLEEAAREAEKAQRVLREAEEAQRVLEEAEKEQRVLEVAEEAQRV